MDLVYGTTVFTDEDIRIVPGIDVDNFRPSVAAGPSHCQLNATETTIAVSVDTCEYGAQSSTTVPPFHIEPQIGDIYAGFKPVTVCGDMQYGPQYPQFPGYDSLVNWEAAKNKVVHDVKRYFHNGSAKCDDWSITQEKAPSKGIIDNKGNTKRIAYETEHVFEGQNIGQFLSQYILMGGLPWFQNYDANAKPSPWNCQWVKKWIMGNPLNDDQWTITNPKDKRKSVVDFIKVILFELGSAYESRVDHQDRLAIFPSRSNQFKGRLFQGKAVYTIKRFITNSKDDAGRKKLFKELGIIFTYMNHPEVEKAWCSTYEAIYNHMSEFDKWYAKGSNSKDLPQLQKKWKQFGQDLLDNFVLKGREWGQNWWDESKKSFAQGVADNEWKNIKTREAKKIKLGWTCKNMDKSRLKVFDGFKD